MYIYKQDKHTPLPAEEAAEVFNVLAKLADHIEYFFSDTDENGGLCQTQAVSQTSCRNINTTSSAYTSDHMAGVSSHSKITLNRERLFDGLDVDPLSSDPVEYLRKWLSLAVTILHEVAHALYKHWNGMQRGEAEFEDQGFVEVRQVAEMFIFDTCGVERVLAHEQVLGVLSNGGYVESLCEVRARIYKESIVAEDTFCSPIISVEVHGCKTWASIFNVLGRCW